MSTTSNGVLNDDMAVKPTMSEKYIVTESKISGFITWPVFRRSATLLQSFSPNNLCSILRHSECD